MMKRKDLQLRLLYPAGLSFTIKGEIKSFQDMEKAQAVCYQQTNITRNVKGRVEKEDEEEGEGEEEEEEKEEGARGGVEEKEEGTRRTRTRRRRGARRKRNIVKRIKWQ